MSNNTNNTSFLIKSHQTSQLPSDPSVSQSAKKIPTPFWNPRLLGALSSPLHRGKNDQRQHFFHTTCILSFQGSAVQAALLFACLLPEAQQAWRESILTHTSHTPYNQNGSFQSLILILVHDLQAENLKLRIIIFNLGLHSISWVYSLYPSFFCKRAVHFH